MISYQWHHAPQLADPALCVASLVVTVTDMEDEAYVDGRADDAVT